MATISADLRHNVIERAENCCEYCLLSQEDYLFPYHIDHIVAEKHAGKTQLDNLCLSCPVCNTFKGSDLGSLDPATGEFSYLHNPRKQGWTEHFRLNNGIIEPLTSEGRVTVFLLRLNQPERVAEREGLIELNRYPCKKGNS